MAKKQKKSSKIMYCCGIDWSEEIGEAPDLEGKIPLYSSIEELKSRRTCWEECGIVEVELTKIKYVVPQNLFKVKKEDIV
jgi:hypothetical protein